MINNLCRFTHAFHLHGFTFYTLGSGYNASKPEAPLEADTADNAACGEENVRYSTLWDPDDPADAYLAWQWGCPYNDSDAGSLNIDNPPMANNIVVPRHAWSVIQFTADNPGFWTFHCHVSDHHMRGQSIMFNVLGEERPLLPDNWKRCPSKACYVTELDEELIDSAYIVNLLLSLILGAGVIILMILVHRSRVMGKKLARHPKAIDITIPEPRQRNPDPSGNYVSIN